MRTILTKLQTNNIIKKNNYTLKNNLALGQQKYKFSSIINLNINNKLQKQIINQNIYKLNNNKIKYQFTQIKNQNNLEMEQKQEVQQNKPEKKKSEEVFLDDEGNQITKNAYKKLQKAKELAKKKAEKAEKAQQAQVQETGKAKEISPSDYHDYRVAQVKEFQKTQNPTPYPHKFHVSHMLNKFVEEFKTKEIANGTVLDIEQEVSVAGRVHNIRTAGHKLVFYDIIGDGDKLQVLYQQERSGESDEAFKFTSDLIKRGDIIGVKGKPCRADKGELSISPSSIQLLSPCLHMLPKIHQGLKDQETRYRKRYLDLILNSRTQNIFKTRSQIIQFLRQFMIERDFLEVETPMQNMIVGGATARPFITYHNDLEMELYMRVAPELYLKTLVVGGMDRVFEIGKQFRNESIDQTHNPEFTSMEFYQAYADYEDIMEMTEQMLSQLVFKLFGTYDIKFNPNGPGTKEEYTISFKPPFRRVKMMEYLQEKLNEQFPEDKATYKALAFVERCANFYKIQRCEGFPKLPEKELDEKEQGKFMKKQVEFVATEAYAKFYEEVKQAYIANMKVPVELETEEARKFFDDACYIHKVLCSAPKSTPRLIDKLVGEFIEVECRNPTFIMEHPQIMSPLAKYHRSKAGLTERFELFVNYYELCNAFTELNDPFKQREIFIQQIEAKNQGDNEAMGYDEGYCKALEHALPPTGGWGLGIDRLVMLLTNNVNIQEVLLFPAMKPENHGVKKVEVKEEQKQQ